MALVAPLGEVGAAFGFGLSRLLAVSRYLSDLFLLKPHLEPVVQEANLAARVVLGLFRVSFECLEQIIRLHPGLHCRFDRTQTGPPVSDPVFGIGRQVETMFPMQRNFLVAGLVHILAGVSRSMRRERPGRSRPRKSMKPRSKWTNRSRA